MILPFFGARVTERGGKPFAVDTPPGRHHNTGPRARGPETAARLQFA
jgi:hypothetical protein